MKSDIDKQIEKHLKDKEFKMYFESAEAKRVIAQQIALLRKSRKLSQADLARQIGTRQQSIARLENPNDSRMPSLAFLERVTKALNRKLVISFVPSR